MNARSRAALAIGVTAAAALGSAGGAALEKGAPHHQARTTETTDSTTAAQDTTTTSELGAASITMSTAQVVLDPVFGADTSTTTVARTIATASQVRATTTTTPAPWTCTVTAPPAETYGGTYTAQVTTSRPAVDIIGQAVDASSSPPAQSTTPQGGTTDASGRWTMTYTLPASRPGQPAGTTPWKVTARGTTDGYPRCAAAVRVSGP